MADRGGFEESLSVSGTSDQIVNIQCDPCKFEGTVSEGIGYCIVCTEYLCSECRRVHKLSRATRGHTLLEGSELPKSRSRAVSSAGPNILCELHQKTMVKFCKSHDSVLCDMCFTIEHRRCEDVVDICQIGKTEGGQDKVTAALTEIHTLTDGFKTLKKKLETIKQSKQNNKQECYTEVKTLRRDIDTYLDQLDTQMYTEIDRAVDNETQIVTDNMTNIDTAIQYLELATDRLEQAKQEGNEHTFLALQKVGRNFNSTKHMLTDARREYRDACWPISFVPDKVLTDLLTTCKQFGRIRINRTSASTRPALIPAKSSVSSSSCLGNTLLGDNVYMSLEPIGRYNANEKGDSRWFSCCITGIVVLSSDDILMCDSVNSKVKLLDIGGQVISSVVLPSKPFNVAVMSDSEAAVTVPDSKTIEVVVVEGRHLKLQKYRVMKTDRKCWGLVYHMGNLYVSCHDNPGNSEVVILDRQGQLITRVPNTDIFKSPFYIAVDYTDRLYISDYGTHTITCMYITGKTVYTRTRSDTGLDCPRDLLVDSDQNLYVAGQHSHNLQILNSVGQLYTCTVKKGLSHPVSIAYRTSDNTLMVGLWGNYIQFYRFTD